MEVLAGSWLPILLSAALVFVASSVLHMVIPLHRGDFAKMPGEDGVLEAMRAAKVAPGEYYFPHAPSMKEMGSPEMLAKYEAGPVGFATVLPSGKPAMGKNLVQWFVFSLVVSFFAAYVASFTLARGADYSAVFRLTGTVAFLAYGVSHVPDSIWKGARWSNTFKHVFDGLVYGLLTAGTFGWLWPGPA